MLSNNAHYTPCNCYLKFTSDVREALPHLPAVSGAFVVFIQAGHAVDPPTLGMEVLQVF